MPPARVRSFGQCWLSRKVKLPEVFRPAILRFGPPAGLRGEGFLGKASSGAFMRIAAIVSVREPMQAGGRGSCQDRI